MLSNIVANDLTHVSVPAEHIKHALEGSSTFVPTHAPSGPALSYPIMPIMDQYFHSHSMSYKLRTTTSKIVIGHALSEAVHLELLSDHISTTVRNLNRCY
jgi:hypothetical protein